MRICDDCCKPIAGDAADPYVCVAGPGDRLRVRCLACQIEAIRRHLMAPTIRRRKA